VGALDPAGGRPDGQAQPQFADTYAQLARRRGNSIATVAIARRLLARCFHILNQLEAAPIGEGQPGCARNNRMRLQHGR
jgi:hypothetical protein